MAGVKHGSFEAKQVSKALLRMTVTNERIVGVRIGGFLAAGGSHALGAHLGLLGLLIGWLIERSQKKKRLANAAQLEETSLDELLAKDKNNFEIRLDTVVGLALDKPGFFSGGQGVAKLTVDTGVKKKIELFVATKDEAQKAHRLFGQALADRYRADPKLAKIIPELAQSL